MKKSAPPQSAKSEILDLVNQAQPHPASESKLPTKRRFTLRLGRKTKIALGIFTIVLTLLIIAVTATVIPVLSLVRQAQSLESQVNTTIASLKEQNLPQAKENISNLSSSIDSLSSTYRTLSWYRFTPLNQYYQDGSRALLAASSGVSAASQILTALEPYADVLGFAGEGSFTGGTAQERILKIIETLQEISPQLEAIVADLNVVDDQIHQIDPTRYPFTLKGYQLDSLLLQAQSITSATVASVTSLKPLLEVLPQIAGIEEEKKYLMIFQNDAEIRATGGFMTAYGVIRVDKGNINQEKSDDIYELDQKFNSRVTPPAILKNKLKMTYWNLRDMNFSPDFKLSMDQFLEYYLTVPNEPKDIDGIIAVDTKVLSDLITVLGPIDVPGFGTFSSTIDPRCDCPEVIYKLEDISTRPVAYIRDDRKSFLVPMMQTLILKAYSAPQQAWPNLFESVFTNIQQKHVLFYMTDPAIQTAMESAGFAGRIDQQTTDYLHINDSNLGGGKANLFITEAIEDQITTSGDTATHDLTITYDNPAPASNCDPEAGALCLNPAYIGYVRIYLPLNSTVTSTLGFDEGSVEEFEELSRKVVAGTFKFQPQSRAKLKINYTVSGLSTSPYSFLIQKQPGKKTPDYTITFNNTDQQKFALTQDKTVVFE